jgi:benzoate/toluate 1,2-dioxygenase alpha subunit
MQHDVEKYVDDRAGEGIFRVHRDVYADPQLFELEMKYIFERTWNFLGVETEIPRPNDFICRWIGRTPVIVTRTAAGQIGAFLNVCPHKGTLLAPLEKGNHKFHVCAYHGWAFDSSGKNVNIKDREEGDYPPAFDGLSHDLMPLARVCSYKGLIFGSLSPDVVPLEDYLGGMRTFIDLAMDQGPEGMEILPGRSAYTYRGNWKMQMDNAQDQYHLTSVHSSFMHVMSQRSAGKGNVEAKQFDWAKRRAQRAGMFHFPYGHAISWINQAEVEKRPIYPVIEQTRARVGAVRADWMLKARNSLIFPNMQIADSTTLNLRTFRPLAVNKTEMRVYCLAPIGEAPDLRKWRIRQFEDFFNPTGFASPDDMACFEAMQQGYAAQPLQFLQGYYRGLGSFGKKGFSSEAAADELGIQPAASQEGMFDLCCETSMHAPYREWARLMAAGMRGEKAFAA